MKGIAKTSYFGFMKKWELGDMDFDWSDPSEYEDQTITHFALQQLARMAVNMWIVASPNKPEII